MLDSELDLAVRAPPGAREGPGQTLSVTRSRMELGP
jgi:hypothetical protein